MLTIQNLRAAYGRREVLNNVSFSLTPHKLTAVIGKNGCGKSTLVSCVNQMLPYTGEISWSGQNLSLMQSTERARLVAILPQMLQRPNVTVEELVAFGRSPYVDLGRRLTAANRAAIDSAITQIGIEELRYAFVDRLSGGERQKAYLAMILAQDTRIIVLDEPTTYMDMAYAGEFFSLLNTLKNRHKKTLMVVMHDLTQAARYADKIVVLDGGTVHFSGTTEQALACGVIEKTFGVKRYRVVEENEERVFFANE